MEKRHKNSAGVFKALCDPNRLIIVEMLQSGEMCACQILDSLDIGQSTLSHHMKSLCQAGVVDCRRAGKWMYYSLNPKGCESAFNVLNGIMKAPVLDNLNERCVWEDVGRND